MGETEKKIEELLTQALAVKDPQDVERVLSELRNALEAHIWHAKVSLATQASLIESESPQQTPSQKVKSAAH